MTHVYKQSKLLLYLKGFTRQFFPLKNVDKQIDILVKSLSADQLKDVERRVDYYNKINKKMIVDHTGTTVGNLLKPKSPKSYYFDTYEYARYFSKDLLIDYAFGDVNTILSIPMITKSRPIKENNENNIILNLDKTRHFVSVDDSLSFSGKKDLMIGRAAVHQEHRKIFYEKYFNHPFCDLGQINKKGGNQEWLKPKISIEEHLKNKFILSLEGNDVATNLKWIMSSNSIAVSPPLKMETWYMEGTLIPDVHFIGINESYDNLEDKLTYFIEHPKESLEIIKNAKEYRAKFNNKNMEDLISLLVLKKYFENIG
ncbi:glycosyl transferase family 90 [Chryseobacterium sp.]|uniref:glycosyl transferase family 90 n=1 Tax=Chryseobacterium sp. TaxID=1871047 RepID=UPI0028A26D58|nr:glycosyl transferase family 90 [Chryseobacterium sp.]